MKHDLHDPWTLLGMFQVFAYTCTYILAGVLALVLSTWLVMDGVRWIQSWVG